MKGRIPGVLLRSGVSSMHFVNPKRTSPLPRHNFHDPIVPQKSLRSAYPSVGIRYECRVSVDLPLQNLRSVISCSSFRIESEDVAAVDIICNVYCDSKQGHSN